VIAARANPGSEPARRAAPSLPLAREAELRLLIKQRRLFACGIGFIDVALLASCPLLSGTSLWTRDRGLDAVASDLGVSFR
jgi:hypothetical protein